MRILLIVPVKEATTALAVKVVPEIWTARLRTDRVAIFRASVSKTSNAVVVVADSAAVIDLGVAGLAEGAALVGSVAAVGADGKN